MNRWTLFRLLMLTSLLALFPLAYYVHAPYWANIGVVYSYDEFPQLQSFPTSDDRLQNVANTDSIEENRLPKPVDIDFEKIDQAKSISIIDLATTVLATISSLESQPTEKANLPTASITIDPAAAPTTFDPKSLATAEIQNSITNSVIANEDTQDDNFRREYDKLACKFPLLDPWDDSILPFLSHPKPLSCPPVQPDDLTYVDHGGYLRFNESAYRKAVSMYGQFECFYRHFDKLDENDHSIMYVDGGKFFQPPESVRMIYENIEVRCERLKQKNAENKEMYWQIHSHPLFASNASLRKENEIEPNLSVLILGVDSISLSAFRRHFPATYAYLRDVMRFHIFKGHHKIADNSFPNQMAVLLGKRVVDEHWPDMMDEVKENYANIRFDHWPLLWRSFEERGYETSFNEDTPHWGLFHYFAQGFKKKPVQHYYHPFWLALSRGENKYQKHCFGNGPKLERQLDLVRRQLTLGRDRKWFDYVFATELFHQDEGYESERADSYFLKFFRDMYEGGYLNKTVVVFMSDHGHRYASLRQTLIGLLEERMPMFNIWFPEWFYKGNDFNATLRNNTVRLTSHFDVHETLLDILDNNYRSSQRPLGTRGLSLLYPIDYDRTCVRAGVPAHYCTCISEQTVAANDTAPIEAVKTAVAHLNLITANTSSCAPLSVSKILRVELLGVNEEIARGVSDLKSAREFDADTGAPTIRPLNKLRITFETAPGEAIFEAITAWNNWKSAWVVDGRVHRLNSYAQTSSCIRDRYLASYCICENAAAK